MMGRDFPLDLDALRHVFDHLNVGAYITDLDRRILLWNRKAEEITGHRAADVVGHACSDGILSHVDTHGYGLCTSKLCPLYRSMQLGRESCDITLVYALKSDGARVPVSVSASPLHDADGMICGGIETFRDETARVRDLEFARMIQRSLLPQSLPDVPGVSMDVLYNPHDLVGGDFYDLHTLRPSLNGLFLADVRGHGVSAALYTMWLKSFEDRLDDLRGNPESFVRRLNKALSEHVVDESFATGIYGVLDSKKGAFTYCNAGHPAPLHYHADTGEITELSAHGMPLGIYEDAVYDVSTADLGPGDMVLLYTDGATEVRDTSDRMLGSGGLKDLVLREMSRGFEGRLQRIYERIVETCGEVNLSDDVTMVSIEVTG
jgi:PAS domain S-box-containing protein